MSTTTKQTAPTKGPWTYTHQLADEGDKQTEIYGKSKHLAEPVCIIPHDDITEKGYEEVKANARLIASAPDLLAVLKEILGWDTATAGMHPTMYARAAQAIAKAEGRNER